jgi:hypothetical protein
MVERILIPPFPGSNPGAPASHRGLSMGISCADGSEDISGGWRPGARSLARKFRGLTPKAAKFGARLCSVIFQYPKSGSGAVRRPVAFPPRPVRIRKQCKFCIAELDAGGSVISVPPKPSEVALKFAAVYRPGPTDIAARLIGQ